MRSHGRRIASWGCLLAVVVAAGCATSRMTEVLNTASDALAYLIRGVQGDVAGQKESARRLAAATFARIVKDQKPADDSILLPAWEGYLSSLSSPISIPVSVYEQNDTLTSGDKQDIANYVKKAPGVLMMRGTELSNDWAKELARVRSQVDALVKVRDGVAADARKCAAAKDYVGALTAYKKAWAIRSGERDLAADLQAGVTAWSQERKAELDAPLKLRLERAAALAQKFGAADPDPKVVADFDQELTGYERRVELIESEAALVREFAAVSGIKGLLDPVARQVTDRAPEVSRLERAFWQEYARTLAKTRRYWDAYRRVDRQLTALGEQKTAQARELEGAVKAAYLSMLTAAVEHYLAKANENYERDRFGAAIVLCLMGEELLDYAVKRNLAATEVVTTWQKRILETRGDVTKKIATRLSRRLIVLDFMIALTDEGENFGYHLRDLCRRAYEDPNPLTWALQVPSAKSIVLKDVQNLTEQDFLVPGHVKEITVHDLPPQELDRRVDKVGSSNIREIPDPLYRITQKEFRTVFSQETFLYQRVRRLHRKEARISYEILYEHGGKKLPLCAVDTRFPTEQAVLPSVTMESTEVSYDAPFLGSPRLSYDRSALPVDPWPKAVPKDLSSDKDISRAVLRWALEAIMKSMDLMVSQYPIADLATRAMELDATSKVVEATEKWGDALLFCLMVSEAQHKNSGAGWLSRRDTMLADTAASCEGRWASHPEKTRQQIRNVWAVSVAHVLAEE